MLELLMQISVWQQRKITSTLDSTSQLALIFCTGTSDTAWNDFAALSDVVLQSSNIFVIDFCNTFSGETAELATTEITCHFDSLLSFQFDIFGMQDQAALAIAILLKRDKTLYLDLHTCFQLVCDALKVLAAHHYLYQAVDVSWQLGLKTLAPVFQLDHTVWDPCWAVKASGPNNGASQHQVIGGHK